MKPAAPAVLVAAAATGALAQLPNDTCSSATPIAGYTTIAFDNTLANTDGPAIQGCNFGSPATIDHDLWYCWTAPRTEWASIRTCYLTALDTRFAVYRGCACPGANRETCGDNECGLQSQSYFIAQEGQTYLIRIGSAAGAPGGAGQFTIEPLILAGPFTYPATQRQYYLLSPSSWSRARDLPGYVGLHGTLTTVRNAEENEFIRTQVLAYDQHARDGWIGYYEPIGSSTFVWLAQRCPPAYVNWAPGEPSMPTTQRWTILSAATGQWRSSIDLPPTIVHGVVETPYDICYPDCNADHVLNVQDFVCFQSCFATPEGCDCNHDYASNVLDFVCFQQAFAAGCSCL